MSDLLATGRIDIDLNDKEAIAGLRALDRDFDRTMRSIDGKEAEVHVTGNLKELKRDLKHAEGLVEGYEKKISDLQEKQEKLRQRKKSQAGVKKEIEDLEKARNALNSQLPLYRKRAEYVNQYLTDLKQTNKEVGNAAQKEKALEGATKRATNAQEAQNKALQDRGRLAARAMAEDRRRHAQAVSDAQTMGRIHARAAQEDESRQRAMIKMHSEAAAMNRKFDHDRLTGLAKEEVAVNKLQAAYSKAYERERRATRRGSQARVLFSPATQQRIDVDRGEAIAEMKLLQAELEAMGERPITQEVDLKLREEHGGAGLFARMANALTSTAVRIGPITTSLGSLTKALALLGPIVTGVVGHLGALAAVVGSGLVGAAGVGAAAVAGFALSLGGVGLALPKLLNDFKNLNTLQDAYHKQVLKTGANSEKAKTKLKEFEHALGEVPPTTLRTFNAIDKLSKSWGQFTDKLRPDFYRGLGAGVDMVTARMGFFQRNTSTAFKLVTDGWVKWMDRLKSDSATGVLATLGRNTNASITPLMNALGNLVGAFGKFAASISKTFPSLFSGFERWTDHINNAASNSDNLDRKTGKLVGSMRSLGHFAQAAGKWLVALFSPGVETGRDALERYAGALDRSAEKMQNMTGRSKLADFFRDATATSEKFIRAMTPFSKIFFEWTTIMRPFTDKLVSVIGFVGDLTEKILGFGPTKAVLTTAFGIFLYGALAKRVVEVGRGIASIAKSVIALKAAGGIGGVLKGGLIKFVTGGAIRGTTPANPLFVMQVGPSRGPGVPGGKTPPVVAGKPPSGLMGRVPGLARVPAIGAGVVGGLGALAGGFVGVSAIMNKISDSRAAEKIDSQLKKLISGRNIDGIKRIQKEYEKFGKTPPPKYDKAIEQIHKLNRQDFRQASAEARKLGNEVAKNWNTMDSKTNTSFKSIKNFANSSFNTIRNHTKKRSEEAEYAVTTNFKRASKSIRQAIREGRVSSEEGTKAIRDLWAKTLTEFGLSKKQARNVAAGKEIHGGPQHASPVQGGAVGGLFNVGGKAGRAAPDNVPAVLNGQPAMIAKGEQVAVFNRHQQKEMDAMHPGGLRGFFSRNKRPHYAAGGGVFEGARRYAPGGIVPVPGFPGESAASSVISMITMIARRFNLILTDAFGQGHKSPGHTQTGTAADFSGPDRNMDAAVKYLTGRGYLVGYDGRFGSQNWPDHGPSTKTSNFHLHVELGAGGKGGAGISMPEIKAPEAVRGLGIITNTAQAMLNSSTSAANFSLQKVQDSMMSPVGGGGFNPGKGAASRSQMVAWAREALFKVMGSKGPTPGNIAGMLELARKESGWVVNSINNWDSNAKAGNPSGGLMHVTLDKVGGSMQALFDPIVNMVASIRYQLSRYGRLITFSPYAQGGLVGEAGKELVANNKTGAVRTVTQPTIMGLSGADSVIPKGEKGAPFMERLARNMGIPAFKKGKHPNKNEGSGNLKQRGSNRKRKKKAMKGFRPERIPSVMKYRDLEEQEDRQNTIIEIADRSVREPEDLVIPDPSGRKDANGEPYYVPNQPEIDRYRGEVQHLIDEQNKMYGGKGSILSRLEKQFRPAFDDTTAYRDLHRHNKKKLEEAIEDDRKLINKKLKGPNKKHLRRQQEKAKKRIEKNKAKLEREKEALSQVSDTREDLLTDHDDVKIRRIPTAQLDLDDQKRIRDSIGTSVSEAMTSANPQPETGTDPTAADSGQLSYGGQQAITSQLMAAVSRDFGNNFTGAQNIPLGGAGRPGGAQGLQDNPAQLRAALGIEDTRFDGGASSLGIGGTGTSGVGGTLSGISKDAAVGSLGSMGPTSGGSAFGDGGGKTVNITNNFKAQPADPLTWAKGVEFEAGAAI